MFVSCSTFCTAPRYSFSEVVVLIEQPDFCSREILAQVSRNGRALGAVGQYARHRPGIILVVAESRRATIDEKLRHLLRVQILAHGKAGRRTERHEDHEDIVALDQPPRLLDRLRRAGAIVGDNELDLSAIDAALIVDHLEVGERALRDHAIGAAGAAERCGSSDDDLGVGNTRDVLCLPRAGSTVGCAW